MSGMSASYGAASTCRQSSRIHAPTAHTMTASLVQYGTGIAQPTAIGTVHSLSGGAPATRQPRAR